MKRHFRLPLIVFTVLAFILASDPPARADIPTGTQIVLIFVAVGAVGAAVGVGVYYAVRKNPSLIGCAMTGPNGLTLNNENDKKTFALIGDLAAIKSGDRIRVQGKRKKDASGSPTFLVEKLRNDYGACKAIP